MARIPVRLEKCPLLETVFEIRFSTQAPLEIIISEVFTSTKDKLGSYVDLPIMQLPANIRKNDPNLKYVACYQFEEKTESQHMQVRVAQKSISFHAFSPYPGWATWKPFIADILTDKLRGARFWDVIERTGLRYINFFENESETLLERINTSISLAGRNAAGKNLQLRLEERPEKDKLSITQIVTHKIVTRMMPGDKEKVFTGAVVDIDCITDLSKNPQEFMDDCDTILEESHNREKDLFYNLLGVPLLDSLKPVWGDS